MATSISRQSGRSGGRRRMMNEINVVPYIDVMLVLLVIFMVTAPLVTPGQVELPSIAKSSQAPAQPLEIIIKADGSIQLRDREAKTERDASKAEAVKAAQEAQQVIAERAIVISADKSVKYEAVLEMMDGLQRAQVKKVGLAVKPAQK